MKRQTNGCIHYLTNPSKELEFIYCKHSTLSYPLHNHISVYTFCLLTEGTLCVTSNNQIRHLTKGDIFVIPPYMPHSLSSDCPYSMISLCISKQLLECTDLFVLQEQVNAFFSTVNTYVNCEIPAQDLQKLLSLLSYSALGKIETPRTHSSFLLKAKEQLELTPEEKISIEALASLSFMSKYAFLRNFKQAFGLSPHQFQLQNRIRKAKRLLWQADCITKVALDTGFCDQSHFIKQFEKVVQLTPSEYQQAHHITAKN